jgi:phosphohistidine phosphatase SixA
MIKIKLSKILLLVCLFGCASSIKPYSTKDFQCYPDAVYLIRHAEKQIIKGEQDPELTKSGFNRATALADSLGHISNGVIYSSEFKRAQQTVNPLASVWGTKVNIQNSHDPDRQIKRALSHCSKTVIISGHSNTIPNLISLFGIEDEVEISDDQYGDLYLIRWENNVPYLNDLQVGE